MTDYRAVPAQGHCCSAQQVCAALRMHQQDAAREHNPSTQTTLDEHTCPGNLGPAREGTYIFFPMLAFSSKRMSTSTSSLLAVMHQVMPPTIYSHADED